LYWRTLYQKTQKKSIELTHILTYNILTAAAAQMNIAMAYGLNMRVEELERMRQKRHKTAVILSKTRSEPRESRDQNQNLLEECQKYKFLTAKALEKVEEWKEKVEKLQDDLLAIKRKPIQIKDPTVDTVEYVLPLQNKKRSN